MTTFSCTSSFPQYNDWPMTLKFKIFHLGVALPFTFTKTVTHSSTKVWCGPSSWAFCSTHKLYLCTYSCSFNGQHSTAVQKRVILDQGLVYMFSKLNFLDEKQMFSNLLFRSITMLCITWDFDCSKNIDGNLQWKIENSIRFRICSDLSLFK